MEAQEKGPHQSQWGTCTVRLAPCSALPWAWLSAWSHWVSTTACAGSLLQSTDEFPLKQTLGVLLGTGRMHWVWLLPHYAVLQLCPIWILQQRDLTIGKLLPKEGGETLPQPGAGTRCPDSELLLLTQTVLTIWQPQPAPCKKSQAEMSAQEWAQDHRAACLRRRGRSRTVHLLPSVYMSQTPPGSTLLSMNFWGIYLLLQLILS